MNYTKTTIKKFEVGIDKNKQYGYFEHEYYGEELGGGLWFENDELVDFDGCYFLPIEVAKAIKKLGFKVNLNDFCDVEK